MENNKQIVISLKANIDQNVIVTVTDIFSYMKRRFTGVVQRIIIIINKHGVISFRYDVILDQDQPGSEHWPTKTPVVIVDDESLEVFQP